VTGHIPEVRQAGVYGPEHPERCSSARRRNREIVQFCQIEFPAGTRKVRRCSKPTEHCSGVID
jgi:hypothetical protein